VLALTAGELRVADVKVEKDIDPDVPHVWADGHQLQQVLVNLITNAKHAMESVVGERRLSISLRRGPDQIRFRVEDSGPGVPAELVSKVFDPFVTTKSEGTGLGLSISYGIISEHGGRIRVESPEGRGAAFTVELPIETPASSEPASITA
jgi:signal transduction histidine kinase